MSKVACKICRKNNLELIIDLSNQPWGNNFLTKEEIGKEKYYPLRLVYCNDCATAQIDYNISKEIMFSDHTYLSGITKTLQKHFESVAQDIDQTFFLDQTVKSVLDIGSNDGTQLQAYKKLGYEVLGVDSSKTTVDIANKNNIHTIHAFFDEKQAQKINQKFDVINASGVFYHLEELHSVCEGIRTCMKKKSVFVVQFIYVKCMQEGVAFDQIYHEHLLYYSLQTLQKLLKQHGMEIFDAHLSTIHGGSVIAYVSLENVREKNQRYQQLLMEEEISRCNALSTYQKFRDDIYALKEKNMNFLEKQIRKKKRIYGFGAPVKGNTLLNFFNIGTDIMPYLVEKNPLRKGLYSPGKHIPLLLEEEVQTPPDIYYVLAWNFKKEILHNNKKLIQRGTEFYFPVTPALERVSI